MWACAVVRYTAVSLRDVLTVQRSVRINGLRPLVRYTLGIWQYAYTDDTIMARDADINDDILRYVKAACLTLALICVIWFVVRAVFSGR